MPTFGDEQSNQRIDELRLHEAEELAKVLADKYQLPYIDLSKVSINTDALRLIPEEEAKMAGAAAFRINGKNIFLAILSPNNPKIGTLVSDFQRNNYSVTTYLASETSLNRAWLMYPEIRLGEATEAGVIDISDEKINGYISKLKSFADIQKALTESNEEVIKGASVSGILELTLSGGLITEASDIHIEPQDEKVRVRYRLDGVLQDVSFIDHSIYRQIISRIKLVSGLRLNIKQSAQDGRFSIHVGENEIEIRTSILPGAYGESIVMRILNPKAIAVTFETLGVEDRELYQIFDHEIKKPNGMVLLTGPTGSGKTTTLYAFLRRVNSSEIKIITIEDPIEYHLQGVNQTQVNRKKSYTFLSGLRSALRQDPDMIMVGEIRDTETAKIAINASLTGHLVFSTLHTNNAAGAIPRLIDLGVNPKILTSALTLPIAQRLLRRLCEKCRVESIPTAEEKKLIDAVVPTIQKKKPYLTDIQTAKVWKPGGCAECNQTGYRGRQGIFEAILMDDAVAAATLANPSEKEIKKAALPQGILDMRQDGILKVLSGRTSLEELSRVVDLDEEIIG